MTLKALKQAYAQGKLPKAEYIEQMMAHHLLLFEYAEFLRDTGISRVELTDGAVVMSTREGGLKFQCDPEDRRLVPLEILNFGDFEAAELRTVLAFVEPGATVFDIGANLGWYSIQLAKRVKDVRLFAFEPLPKTFRALEQHLALNGVTQVKTARMGFFDKEGELTFYFDPQGSGNASAADLTGLSRVERVVCRVARVDDYALENGVTVDFIKCDVEGAELPVFKGAVETLRRDRPVVFVEMLRKWSAKFNYHPNETLALFAGLGYHCYAIRDGTLVPFKSMDETSVETNFFFVDPDRHRAALERALAAGASWSSSERR